MAVEPATGTRLRLLEYQQTEQDKTNATLHAAIAACSAKVDRVYTLLMTLLVTLVVGLIILIFQLQAGGKS